MRMSLWEVLDRVSCEWQGWAAMPQKNSKMGSNFFIRIVNGKYGGIFVFGKRRCGQR